MLMDGFTVAAQIVNFIVLVLVLRWLLWDRIVDAMDARRRRIEEQFDEAEREREEARRAAERKEEAETEFRRQRDDMLREAREKADARRDEMLEEVREEIDARRASWEKALRDQQDDFVASMRRELGAAVTDVAREVLASIADAELEQRIVDRFADRLADLSDEDRARLAPDGDEHALRVTSAFELDDDQRARLAEAVRDSFGEEISLRFETDEDLVCGLRVRGAEHTVELSLDRALRRIDDRVRERLESGEDTEPAPEPAESAS